MSPGFRRKGSHSTLGLVRETAKVVARTDCERESRRDDRAAILVQDRLDGT
jgi:hypothetical protein